MTITVQDLITLQDQIDQVTLALAGTISGRELSAAITMLEQQMARVASRMNDIDPRVVRLQSQVNSITTRFKRYASNEQLINSAAEVLPSAAEHSALAGSWGIPGASNEYVTSGDPRMGNARFPTPHSHIHSSGEVDAILHQSLSGAGALTHAQLETELQVIKAREDSVENRVTVTEQDIAVLLDDLSSISADSIPEGTVKRVPTIEELARILSTEQLEYLLNSGFLTEVEGDSRYLPIDTPIPPINVPTTPEGIPLWASVVSNEIQATLLPRITGSYNLGSPTKAFNKIYAYQFIDVDGNSIIIKDKHLGYNGTNELRFGDDKIILEPEFIEAIRKVDEFSTSSVLDLQAQISITTAKEMQDVTYLKELISGIKLQASLNQGAFKDYITDCTWEGIKNKPEALNHVDDLSKFKGILPSFTNLPTTGVSLGDLFITTVSEIPNVIGVYSVISTSGDRKQMYRSAYTNEGISHSKLLNTLNDDCHPQYVTKTGLDSAILSCGTAIKEVLGINSSRFFMTSTHVDSINNLKAHAVDVHNPHNISCATINALENKDGVIKVRHIEQLTVDNIRETSTKFFMNSGDVSILSSSVSHISNADLHWDTDKSAALLGGGSTTAHYHSEDRKLENAVGILPLSRLNLEHLSEVIRDNPAVKDCFVEKHSKDHNLASHTDTVVTGEQLNTLYSIHDGARRGVQNAHNCAFVGYDGIYGVSDSVARGDHHHDSRYQCTSSVNSALLTSDPLGTIKTDEEYLYVRVKSGWKRTKLENLS